MPDFTNINPLKSAEPLTLPKESGAPEPTTNELLEREGAFEEKQKNQRRAEVHRKLEGTTVRQRIAQRQIERNSVADLVNAPYWDNEDLMDSYERRGFVTPELGGFWKTTGRRLKGGVLEYGDSILNSLNKISAVATGQKPETAMFGTQRELLRQYRSTRHHLDAPVGVNMMDSEFWGSAIGGNLPQSLMFIAEIAATGGLLSVAGASAKAIRLLSKILPVTDIFLQTYGPEVDRLVSEGVPYDVAMGSAIPIAALVSGIEMSPFGGKKRMSNALLGRINRRTAMQQASMWRRMGMKYLSPSGNILREAAMGGVGEGIEELLQLGVQDMASYILTGRKASSPYQYFENFAAALPLGGLLGSMAGVVAVRDDAVINKAFSDAPPAQDSLRLFPETVANKFTKAFDGLTSKVKTEFPDTSGVEQAMQVVREVMLSSAVRLSMSTGKIVDPMQFFEELQMVFERNTKLKKDVFNAWTAKETDAQPRDRVISALIKHNIASDIFTPFQHDKTTKTFNNITENLNKETDSKLDTVQPEAKEKETQIIQPKVEMFPDTFDDADSPELLNYLHLYLPASQIVKMSKKERLRAGNDMYYLRDLSMKSPQESISRETAKTLYVNPSEEQQLAFTPEGEPVITDIPKPISPSPAPTISTKAEPSAQLPEEAPAGVISPEAKPELMTPKAKQIIDVMNRGSNESVDSEGITRMGEIEFSDWVKGNSPLRGAVKEWLAATKQHSLGIPTRDLSKWLEFQGYDYPSYLGGRDAFAQFLKDVREGDRYVFKDEKAKPAEVTEPTKKPVKKTKAPKLTKAKQTEAKKINATIKTAKAADRAKELNKAEKLLPKDKVVSVKKRTYTRKATPPTIRNLAIDTGGLKLWDAYAGEEWAEIAQRFRATKKSGRGSFPDEFLQEAKSMGLIHIDATEDDLKGALTSLSKETIATREEALHEKGQQETFTRIKELEAKVKDKTITPEEVEDLNAALKFLGLDPVRFETGKPSAGELFPAEDLSLIGEKVIDAERIIREQAAIEERKATLETIAQELPGVKEKAKVKPEFITSETELTKGDILLTPKGYRMEVMRVIKKKGQETKYKMAHLHPKGIKVTAGELWTTTKFIRDKMRIAPIEGVPFQADAEVIKGMYINNPQNNRNAIIAFFKESNAETIIHEFLHHLIALDALTYEQRTAFEQAFNFKRAGYMSFEEEERVVDAFIQFIKTGALPPDTTIEAVRAFNEMQTLLAQILQEDELNSLELSPDIESALGKLFGLSTPEFNELTTAQTEVVLHGFQTSAIESVLLKHLKYEQDINYNDEIAEEHGAQYSIGTRKPKAAFHIQFKKLIKTSGETKEQVRARITRHIGKGYILAKDDPSGSQKLNMTDADILRATELIKLEMADTTPMATPEEKQVLQLPNRENLLKGLKQLDKHSQRLNVVKAAVKTKIQPLAGMLEKFLQTLPDNVNDSDIADMNIAYRMAHGIKDVSRSIHLAKGINLIDLCARLGKPFTDFFVNPLLTANEISFDMRLASDKRLKKLFDDNNVDASNVFRQQLFTAHETKKVVKLNTSEMLGIYMRTNGDNLTLNSSRNFMASNPDITPSIVRQVVDYIAKDKPAKFLLTHMQEENSQILQPFRDAVMLTTGQTIGDVGINYLSNIRDLKRFDINEDTIQIFEDFNMNLESFEAFEKRVTAPSYAMERKLRSKNRLKLDALSIHEQYMNTVRNYIAKAELIQQLLAILDSHEVAGAMYQKFGGDDKVRQTLREMVYREHSISGHTGTYGVLDNLFRKSRRLAVPAFLTGPLTPFRAISSLLPAMAYTDTMSAIRTFGKLFFQGIQHFSSEHPLERTTEYQDMLKDFSHLYFRYNLPEIEEWAGASTIMLGGQAVSRGRHTIKLGGKSLIMWALHPLRFADAVAVTSAYTAAKEYYLSHSASDPKLKAEYKSAADYAIKILMATQPPTLLMEKTLMQTGTELEKQAIIFTGQIFKNYGRYLHDIVMPVADALMVEGSPIVKARALRKTVAENRILRRIAWTGAIPAIVLGAIGRRRWQRDKDEMLMDLVFYPFQQLPMIGSVIGAKRKGWDMDVYHTIWTDVVKTAIDVSTQTGLKFVKGDEHNWHVPSGDIYRVMSAFSGMPNYPIRVMQRFYDTHADKYPGLKEYIRRNILLAPKREWETP